jgi:hypothetical protein
VETRLNYSAIKTFVGVETRLIIVGPINIIGGIIIERSDPVNSGRDVMTSSSSILWEQSSLSLLTRHPSFFHHNISHLISFSFLTAERLGRFKYRSITPKKFIKFNSRKSRFRRVAIMNSKLAALSSSPSSSLHSSLYSPGIDLEQEDNKNLEQLIFSAINHGNLEKLSRIFDTANLNSTKVLQLLLTTAYPNEDHFYKYDTDDKIEADELLGPK